MNNTAISIMAFCVLCLLGGFSVSHADPLPIDQFENVMVHQYCLRLLGFYAGPIDGVIGPQTEAAVKKVGQHYASRNVTKPEMALIAMLNSCAYRMMVKIVLGKPYPAQETPQGWPQPLYDPLRR